MHEEFVPWIISALNRAAEVGVKAVQVYLDSRSLSAAASGNGNVSAGIRIAIAEAQKNCKKTLTI